MRQVQDHIEASDKCATREEIIEKFNLQVKKTAMSRYIHSFGLRGGQAPKKFLIKHLNQVRRADAAIAFSELTVEDCKKFVFNDESSCDNSPSGNRHIWRPIKVNRHNPDYAMPIENSTFRVNFFSWVSKFGTGKFFYGTMNFEVFCSIIPQMIDILRSQFRSDYFKIILDNAAFHKSHHCLEKIEELGLRDKFVLLPPYSPYMNIIENLWVIGKKESNDICSFMVKSEIERNFRRLEI